jgi:uncharacterized membrane protein
MMVNINKKTEEDLQAAYNIGGIKNVLWDTDDESFYVLCNFFEEKLGFFVLKINPHNWPTEKDFLVKWKHKLDIDDCAMFVLRDR